MTQYQFQSDNLLASVGWDEPLQCLFLDIEALDSQEILFSNLSLANPAMDIEQILETCSRFEILLPHKIVDSLKKDAGFPHASTATGQLRALLIDPHNRTVSEHQIDPDSREARSTLCGWEISCTARLLGCLAFVNDLGLTDLIEPAPPRFGLNGYPYPLADKVLLFGPPAPDGETTPCPLTSAEVFSQVDWNNPPDLPAL